MQISVLILTLNEERNLPACLAAAEAFAAGAPVVLTDGVNMGECWPAPPVWRVKQDALSITKRLAAALSHSRKVGLPSREALELAERKCTPSPVQLLAEFCDKILAEHE